MGEGLILETERLQLRQLKPSDVDALELVLGDPVAMKFYPAPYTREEVTEWIGRNIARYETEGFGLWAMVLKSSGELIGDCGCVTQEVEGRKEIEIAYHVRRDLWGNGYATEAARACMDYAFSRLGTRRVISIIKPDNLSSRRVAEKNGLACEKMAICFGTEHCIYMKEKVDTDRT
jgi:RimJ/RimL family protein N-acetyltransferase